MPNRNPLQPTADATYEPRTEFARTVAPDTQSSPLADAVARLRRAVRRARRTIRGAGPSPASPNAGPSAAGPSAAGRPIPKQ
jgi:hypothetical protein